MGKLKDSQVANTKPRAEPYKLADGLGLYLYVTPKNDRHKNGAKSWRYDYRIAGKRETLTIGKYPDVSLALARKRHGEARELVAAGKSPAKDKRVKIERAKLERENTVEALCENWFHAKAHARSLSWQSNTRRWLDEDIYPALGAKPIQQVNMDDLEPVLLAIAKDRGASSARQARLMLASVWKSLPRSLGCGNPPRDLGDVAEIHKREPRGKPMPAKHLPALLETIEKSPARQATKLAARLLLLTFTRKRELIEATWDELDLQRSEWTIPAERMKSDRLHIVPLSWQAVKCFEYLKPLSADSRFVFPNLGSQDKPMGATTLNKFFHEIGYPHFTPHSARSTASTILNGQGFDGDAIELQLAHAERSRTRAAYNYADKLEERRRMMQAWADFIDAICAENVIPMQRGKAAA